MKISIFPKALALPKGREQKQKESYNVSKPNHPKIIEINDENDLIDYVTRYAWSPSIFAEYRHNDGFLSTDFMVLDIDQGMRIEEAEKKAEALKLCHLILPSPSFTPEHHKFRIILPLVETIRSKQVFDLTWTYLQEQFPQLDTQCSDYARFYFASTTDNGVYGEGKLLVPVKPTNSNEPRQEYNSRLVKVENYADLSILEILYGKVPETVPESVDFFLKNAHTGMEGEWINSLNSCIFTLALQGCEESAILEVLERISPYPLDKRDMETITKAFNDGREASVDN